MSNQSTSTATVLTVVGILVAICAWISPFHPTGHSPIAPTPQPESKTSDTTQQTKGKEQDGKEQNQVNNQLKKDLAATQKKTIAAERKIQELERTIKEISNSQKENTNPHQEAESTLVVHTSLPLRSSSLTGKWTGKYVCAQGVTGLNLTILPSNPSALKAQFDFFPLRENPGVPNGSFLMFGSYDPGTSTFRLWGGDWLRAPAGYTTVNLAGELNGQTLSGRVDTPGCDSFWLSRASD